MIAEHEIIVDLFAGGGGASQGIRMALGRKTRADHSRLPTVARAERILEKLRTV